MADDLETGVVLDPDAGGEDLDAQLEQLEALPEGTPDRKWIPVVQALRQKAKDAETRATSAEEREKEKDDTLLLYQMQLRQSAGTAAAGNTTATAKPVEDDLLADLEEDEYLNKKQALDLVKRVRGELTTIQTQTQSQLRLQAITSQPDFNEVVNKHLPEVLKADPSLAEEIRRVPDEAARWALAYRLGKLDPVYQKKLLMPSEMHPDAKRAAENLKKPGALAKVAPGVVVVDQADQIRGMTPAQFRQYRQEQRQAKRQQDREVARGR